MRHDIINTGSAPVSRSFIWQLVRDGTKPANESSFYSTFTGLAVHTSARSFQKVEFADIENKADFEKSTTDGYVAMVQHYFASARLLPDALAREAFMRKVDNNCTPLAC